MRTERGQYTQKTSSLVREASGVSMAATWLLAATLCAAPAEAQLPLSIEALLMPASTLSLSTQTHWRQDRQPVLAIRDDGSAYIGHRRVEQGVTSLGARYGVTPSLELSARLSHRQLRWREPGGTSEQARGYSADVGLGWLARAERGSPALLLDARVDLVSQASAPEADQEWLDGVEFGAIAYRSLDPLVVSLSARYRYQRERSHAGADSHPSRSILLAPQVNFAVNTRVTLVGGLSAQYRDVSAVRSAEGASGVASWLRFGVGYAASGRSTMFLNTSVATSGAGQGAGFDLEWLYRFR